MTSPITSATQTPPVASTAPVKEKSAPAESKPQPAAAPKTGTTVTISNAARAALAEATETAAQTAKEAQGGDHQAQQLLAKETAAKGKH